MHRVPQRRSRRQSPLQILYIAAASCLAGLGALAGGPRPLCAAAAPGFVALEDVAPDIVQEIRYAGSFNFTGAPLPGYATPRCYLLAQAAQRLAAVDAQLSSFGLGLKVYDCYRPAQASLAMVRWARQQTPLGAAERYFLGPLTRAAVLEGHFVAPRSRHNHGTTVDVTVVPRHAPARPLDAPPSAGARCDEASDELPTGTSHDCFDARSATRAPEVSPAARALRALLLAHMREAGFVNYAKEWWHFTLPTPAPATPYDWVIR